MVRLLPLCFLMTLLLPATSCVRSGAARGRAAPGANADLRLPVVAVTDFENRSGFRGQWSLGDGFADLLSSGLLGTQRYVVLDRRNLDDVLREQQMQRSQGFREEGRVSGGKLKSAQYLIRGTLTDFTVTGDGSGWFGAQGGGARGILRGGSQTARVALVLKVVEVETGEILNTIETSGEASSGWFGGAVDYKGVSFGGDSFFRTPLGEATQNALADAVKVLRKGLPARPWDARVAGTVNGRILINGGRNCGVRNGQVFRVRVEGQVITDPVTGNALHRLAGAEVGRLEVTEVTDTAAWARLVSGRAERGMRLEPDRR